MRFFEEGGEGAARRQAAAQQGFLTRQGSGRQAQIAQGGKLAGDEAFAAGIGCGHSGTIQQSLCHATRMLVF